MHFAEIVVVFSKFIMIVGGIWVVIRSLPWLSVELR
jgi:hypothetical protein